jgi:hypothetical protein
MEEHMPQLGHLWLGTVTAGDTFAGTDSPIVLIVNVGGDRIDNVHHTFPDTAQDDLEGDQANIYEVTQDQMDTVTGFLPATVDTETLNTSSIRIATRGSGQWIPKSVFVWGREERDVGEVVPLALVINLRPSIVVGGSLAGVTLSTDSDEGHVSFGVPRVTPGGAAMPIRGLIVAMITADEESAGTDDLVQLRVMTAAGQLVVDELFADTDQADQEQGQANIYFVPVSTPFTRAELNDRSIELSIRGDDMWLPTSFFLFGLGEELPARFSPLVEPLVHLATWPFGWMSTDANEGRESARLPLVPLPPAIP